MKVKICDMYELGIFRHSLLMLGIAFSAAPMLSIAVSFILLNAEYLPGSLRTLLVGLIFLAVSMVEKIEL